MLHTKQLQKRIFLFMNKTDDLIEFIGNNEWEIETPSGWQTFKGLARYKKKQLYSVTTETHKNIVVTSNHCFINKNKNKILCKNALNKKICTKDGLEKVITITKLKKDFVYDVASVSNGSVFYANKILNHNTHILEEFWSSVIPAISSGKKTKILLVSTPNGVGNKFYEIYSGAENGTLPSWSASRIDWWDKPGRDEKWKSDQIQLLGSEEKFLQEFANAFLDSYSTAVGSDIIERFKKTKKEPIWSSEDGTYIVFEPPNPSRMYAIGVDVGEGIGRAASVAQILDVTDLKQIEQVAIYTSPVIEPFHFANKLKTIAESWGIPPMLIERNNCGAQVIDALHYTHQYEKIVGHSKVSEKDRYNKTRCLGVLSHHNIKFDGIQNMRYWINHLQCVKINDSATISEFETFVRFPHGVFKKRNDSFFDDRVMSLVWALFILEPTICEQYFQIDNFDNQQKPAAISNNNYWGVDLENFILRDLDSRAEIFTPPVEQQVNQQSSSLIKFSEKELNKLDLFNLTMEDLVEEGYTPFNFD